LKVDVGKLKHHYYHLDVKKETIFQGYITSIFSLSLSHTHTHVIHTWTHMELYKTNTCFKTQYTTTRMPLTCLWGLIVKSDKLHWKICENIVYKDSLHPKIFHEQAAGILVLLDSKTVICLKQTPVLAARNWARTRPFYNIISIPQK
jgi:hypothetical protein